MSGGQILAMVLFALFMYMPMRVIFWKLGWDRWTGDPAGKSEPSSFDRL